MFINIVDFRSNFLNWPVSNVPRGVSGLNKCRAPSFIFIILYYYIITARSLFILLDNMRGNLWFLNIERLYQGMQNLPCVLWWNTELERNSPLVATTPDLRSLERVFILFHYWSRPMQKNLESCFSVFSLFLDISVQFLIWNNLQIPLLAIQWYGLEGNSIWC